MNRQPPPRAQAPFFDRLLGTEDSGGVGIARLRDTVHRDLEALLNARRPWRTPPPGAARNSLLGFGLPDFAAGSTHDPAQRDTIRAAVEETIRRFEPRLADLRVTIAAEDRSSPSHGPSHGPPHGLRLRIEAVLLAAALSEPVQFDTMLDPATKSVRLHPVAGH